jgi:hypothetical protein
MPDKLQTQLTLVTHYGDKPDSFANLIIMLQDKLSESFGSAFGPYDLEQVHATIIGFEGLVSDRGIESQWFFENSGSHRIIDPKQLLEFLRSDEIKDIEFKIGGWLSHNNGYGFTSRGQHPFIRSFSIQGEIAVAMGWPLIEDQYSEELYQLRKSFESVNVLHKWHKDGYKDNDLFFVLGRVSKDHLNPFVIKKATAEIRVILSGVDERVIVGRDTMSIVAYVDPQLPIKTSESFDLNDPNLTPQLIKQLYKQRIAFR